MLRILISTVFFYFITPILAIYNCTYTTTCACGKSTSRGYDLDCPNAIMPKVQISFDLETRLYQIDCRQNVNYTYYLPHKYLPPDIEYKKLTLESLVFDRCSLPKNKTLEHVMGYLKIKSTKKMVIKNSNLRHIKRSDLKGLEEVKSLVVTENSMSVLPDDLIYDLKNLTHLDMQSNQVTIPQNFFKELTELKMLDISDNDIPENTTGMFENLVKIENLYMWMMNIQEIDADMFKNMPVVENIDLSINNIKYLPENIFSTLTNLKTVSLKRNSLNELPNRIFENNVNLQTIILDDNSELSNLPSDLFKNLKELTKISACFCSLTTIDEHLFEGLSELKNIELNNNNISYLPAKVFQNLVSLEKLELQSNKLGDLPRHLFKRLRNLKELNLAGNVLQLTSSTFFGLNQLQIVNLHNNQLNNINPDMWDGLNALKKIDLSNNQLTAFPTSLVSLEELILSNNNLTQTQNDWLISKPKLRKLDLSYNNFKKLKSYDFNYISNEITIDFGYNEITDINLDDAEIVFKPNPNHIKPFPRGYKNIRVKLYENPLHCSCNLYNLYRYYNDTMDPEVHGNLELESNDLHCVTPEYMKGMKVKDIQPGNFVCELNKENVDEDLCPKNVGCYLQPSIKTVLIDYSFIKIDEMPRINSSLVDYLLETYKYLKNVNVTLNISRNDIKNLERRNGYDKVTVLDASRNRIENVHWLPENVEVLYLHGNNISVLNSSDLSIFNSMKLRKMTLYDNPWDCSCDAVDFMKYLQDNYEKVDYVYNITCKGTDMELAPMTVEQLCPLAREVLIVSLITVAIISLLVTVLSVMFYRFNTEIKVWLYAHEYCLWWVTEEELDKEKVYDAFISYSHKDEDFVVSELLPKLEECPNPYKLCLHFRNWLPGEFITSNIARSIAESRRTIVILSPSFLESEWGKMEFRTAHTQALNEGRARVIIVLLGEVPIDTLDNELKAYLSTNTYVKWGDPWFWDKLRYALPHQPSFLKQNLNQITVKINEDKLDLIHEPSTPPILSTPPADKMNFEPILLGNAALNVSLVNGTLINNHYNEKLNNTKNLY